VQVLERTGDRQLVVKAFVDSTEFRQGTVIMYYRDVLGRDFAKGEVSSAEIAGWVNAGDLSLDQVLNGFLASDEFYTKSGGTDELYVKRLYLVQLQRPGEPDGVANWVGLLQSGHPRDFVVGNIGLSRESINRLYLAYLHRNADPQGLDGFFTAFARGNTLRDIQVSILSSDEYFLRP
jgi:hypothetical protein